jgi:hypothetical protein
MLVLLLASVVGAGSGGPGAGLLAALAVAQVAFYAGAVVGKRAGKLGGVARTFVVLNAAAVVGLFRFASGQQRVTWASAGAAAAGSAEAPAVEIKRP